MAEILDQWFFNGVDAGGAPLGLGVRDGLFTRVGSPEGAPAARRRIDLQGRVVLPGLVDGHIHLDKSFVGDRWHPHVPSTSLKERLAIEKAQLAQARPIDERADALVAQAAGFGTIAMRCHVDVDATTGLVNLQAIAQVRERWRGRVDVELVAFPQAGVMSCPGTVEVLDQALSSGADAIGGIDPTVFDGDAKGQLDAIFDLAGRHGAKVDIHLHEPGQQGITQLQAIAQHAQAAGLAGRVAVSHAYALGEVDASTARRTADVLARAGVAIMTNAPGARPFPPVRLLREAGVTVFAGSDNIRDAWWPYGNGDMLQRAMLVGYRSGFYTDDDLRVALELVTQAGAQVLGLERYGLAVGHPATFLAVRAANGAEAVAAAPADRLRIRRGEVLE